MGQTNKYFKTITTIFFFVINFSSFAIEPNPDTTLKNIYQCTGTESQNFWYLGEDLNGKKILTSYDKDLNILFQFPISSEELLPEQSKFTGTYPESGTFGALLGIFKTSPIANEKIKAYGVALSPETGARIEEKLQCEISPHLLFSNFNSSKVHFDANSLKNFDEELSPWLGQSYSAILEFALYLIGSEIYALCEESGITCEEVFGNSALVNASSLGSFLSISQKNDLYRVTDVQRNSGKNSIIFPESHNALFLADLSKFNADFVNEYDKKILPGLLQLRLSGLLTFAQNDIAEEKLLYLCTSWGMNCRSVAGNLAFADFTLERLLSVSPWYELSSFDHVAIESD